MMKFFIIFFSILLSGQQRISTKYIDSGFAKTEVLAREGKYDEYIKKTMLLLKNSKAINYSKGIALAYLNLSCGYSYASDYKKGLEYLRLAKNQEYAQNDFDFQILIKNYSGFNYYNMGLYQEAIAEFKEITILSDEISTDSLRIFHKSYAYCEIGAVYKAKNQLDSSKFYIKKGINILRREKKMTARSKSMLLWYSLGLIEINIDEKKIDSAEINLKPLEAQSKRILGNSNSKLYKIKGLINEHKKEYDSAIVNYQKSIQLAKKGRNIVEVQWLYNAVSKVYKQVGNEESAREYLQKYTSVRDSLTNAKQSAIESTVKELVVQKENKIKNSNKFLFYGICTGALGLFILIFLIVRRLHKNNTILNRKEQETRLLSQKLNVAFEEVVQLAKNNDSEFLTRFQEVYPEFFPKLLEIEPQLLNTELKFCALLFLNFSTKDIATYTFVQPQSIQTRKNRLRKKLKISSDEDIYVWMKNVNKTFNILKSVS
ncbi:hypothetical protein NZD88_17415 [Chryseobacterium antibioticum]|uniref:Tetratricopeptide repeat protein n=1 Tax=Chryseobacterium pyrolae TaxID=2987481 RepID=A0ABT2IKZ6_9FLAO|nr:hypothetical protein [Chryseobacterium pyrolae]MCT2409331.1 hypothetical protein [Chryseobacterium pyrolae]